MAIDQEGAFDDAAQKPLISCNLSTRAFNCVQRNGVNTVGQLSALRSTDVLRWPNSGKKTMAELARLLGSFGLKFSDDSESQPVVNEIPSSSMPKPEVLEDELYGLVSAVSNDRNAQIIIKLWGWNGNEPRTLESVGQEFSLTRERIRQIQARVLKRLKRRMNEASILRKAIDILRNAAPDERSLLATTLRKEGISRNDFCPDSVQVAADCFGIEWPFEHIKLGNKKVLAVIGEGSKYRDAVTLLRRMSSEFGCVMVLHLASEVNLGEKGIPGLLRFLRVIPEVQWLDESRQWVYSSATARNRLYNICAKVLGVTPKVHLSELRRAVSRSRRMAISPPQYVLRAFIEQSGLGSIKDSVVLANPEVGWVLPENSAEAIMLRVLDDYGPVMDGEEFAERCITAGINSITFYIYRSASPVITPLGRSIYCKVGTEVLPGTIEKIIAMRRSVKRVSDYGWTNTGRLWAGLELSRAVITSGSIALPSFVADLAQGEWVVILPDGTQHGKVTCRDAFIWSFHKQFAMIGIEPADLVVMEFDLKSRQVKIRVGGPDLLETMQEPNCDVMDDEGEDV